MPVYEKSGVVAAGDQTVKLCDNVELWLGDGAEASNPELGDAKLYFDGTDVKFTGTDQATAATAGAAIAITAAKGGTSGAGGAASLTGGVGGTTGTGGAASLTSGAGGTTSGASGAVTVASGAVTAASGSASGAVTIQSAAGATHASTGGASGAVTVKSNAGGVATSGTGGAGGTVSITGGAGGAATAGTGGAGATVAITAGAGGNGATASGAPGNVTVTAGSAGTGGNVDGGSVVITSGAKVGTGTDGMIINRGLVCKTQGAPTAETGVATLSVADLRSGIITITHTAGATVALTLDTGANMDAGLPADFAAGDSFDWTVINLSTAEADTATITASNGHTIIGAIIVPSAHANTIVNSSATYRTRKTGADTFVTYRI